MLLTSVAYAGSSKGFLGFGGGSDQLILMVIMIAIFYFILIRPQQKKEKERKKLTNSVVNGDKVLTAGGIYGTVSAVKKEQGIVVVKIADGTKVEFAKSAIQQKINPESGNLKK